MKIKQEIEEISSRISYKLYLEMNNKEYEILINTFRDEYDSRYEWEIYDDKDISEEEYEEIEEYLESKDFKLENIE